MVDMCGRVLANLKRQRWGRRFLTLKSSLKVYNDEEELEMDKQKEFDVICIGQVTQLSLIHI